MITTNINTTPPNYEEEINSFYLTQLDRTYDEGVVLTKSSSIGCRPLAFAIKAGTKILINGISLEVYSDAAQSAVEFFITATTLTESINKGAKITIDKENLFLQYQRKTEGQVAGFDIDADGISKGGVEITGWLNSDTLEGATINNLPTALSVKNYVDNSHPAEDQTLQEVTDRGNTTTNDIIGASLTLGDGTTSESAKVFYSDGTYTKILGYGLEMTRSTSYIRPTTANTNGLRLGDSSLNWSYIANYADTHYWFNATSELMRITSAGNVGIGTTSPSSKIDIYDDSTIYAATILNNNSGGKGLLIKSGNGGGGTNAILDLADKNSNIKVRVVENGNVGIGTTAPTEKLEVVGKALFESVDIFKVDAGANPRLRIGRYSAETLNFDIDDSIARIYHLQDELSATIHQLKITVDSDSTAGAKINLGFRDKDGTNESTKLTVVDTGNVGIGTTAPTEKLHVVGDALITGGLEVNAANIDFRGLGTSDPGVVGRLWQDSGILKISEG